MDEDLRKMADEMDGYLKEHHDRIRKMIAPRKVAVIGASSKPGKVGEIITRQLVEAGFDVYPVHPKEEEIHGRRVYHSVSELPDGIDLAVVTLAARRAVDASIEAAQKGIPAIIVVAGGFKEAGGEDLETRLVKGVRAHGAVLLGPNTLGLMDTSTGLDTLFVRHVTFPRDGRGRIAFISQSGSVGTEATALAAHGGLNLAAFVGLGNKADLNELSFLHHYMERDDVDALMFYLENVSAGRHFLGKAAVASLQKGKPVVVLKAGRTKTAAAAVASHTGSLAGSYRVMEGALRQHGLIQATSDEEMIDFANALALAPLPRGNRVGVFTPAGGFGVMAVDEVEREDHRPRLVMARPTSETQQAIRNATFPFVATGNPVDLTASVTVEMYAEALRIFASDPNVDLLVVGAFFSPAGLGDPTAPALADAARWVMDELCKPVVMFVFDGDRTFERTSYFHQRGIPAYPSVRRAVRAARVLVERAQMLERARVADGDESPRIPIDVLNPGSFRIQGGSGTEAPRPDEWEAKRILARLGFRIPRGWRIIDEPLPSVDNGDEFVVKVCDPDVLHKTERGGVMLGIRGPDLDGAVQEMRRRFPGSPVLVEEMVRERGVEMILGVTRDPDLGAAIALGWGGIYTEVLGDVSFRLAPLTRHDVHEMLSELKVAKLLDFRGFKADVDALVDAVVNFSRFVAAHEDHIETMDLNPVLVTGSGPLVLDAKMVLR